MEGEFFDAGFVDEADAALGEIAETSVEESGGAAAGAEGKVVAVDEGNAESAHGGIACDAGADDSAAGDEDVPVGLGEVVEGGGGRVGFFVCHWELSCGSTTPFAALRDVPPTHAERIPEVLGVHRGRRVMATVPLECGACQCAT